MSIMNAHEQMEQHIAAAARRFVSKAVAVAIDDGIGKEEDRDATVVTCLGQAIRTYCLEADYGDGRRHVEGIFKDSEDEE